MSDQGDEPSSTGQHAQFLAASLLDEGLPFDLTYRAAKNFSERCEAVLYLLPPTDAVLTVKLMAAQTIALSHGQIEAARDAAKATQAMADRLDDEVAQAYAHLAWGYTHPLPEHSTRRVENAYAVLDIATRHKESELFPATYALLLVALLELGEIRTLDVELLEQRDADLSFGGSNHAHVIDWFYCLRSILDGDTDSAEKQALGIYNQATVNDTDALALYTAQTGMIRWMRGELEGFEDSLLAARREYPEQYLWAASLAWLWLLQGRKSASESVMRSLPAIDEIPHDNYWLSTMTVLAEIASRHESREFAEKIRETLLPFADHLVPVGSGVGFWGTVARSLGLVEERLGLFKEAREHLELAIETSARVGAIAWHAEAQIEVAQFALRNGIDDIPAYDLLAEARATARARGFPVLALRAMHNPRIRVLGRFEVISVCGKKAIWSSRKARELLKMLIAARGTASSREVYMDALWPDEPPEALSNRFSVAVNVIRRALDPEKLLPTQHHVVTEGDSVYLAVEHLDIDLEQFFAFAQSDDEKSRQKALALYRGDVFSEEPYADWASSIRDHAALVKARLGSGSSFVR